MKTSRLSPYFPLFPTFLLQTACFFCYFVCHVGIGPGRAWKTSRLSPYFPVFPVFPSPYFPNDELDNGGGDYEQHALKRVLATSSDATCSVASSECGDIPQRKAVSQ